MFHISIWEGLEFCLGRLSPTKAPRGDGTVAAFLPFLVGFPFGYIHLRVGQCFLPRKCRLLVDVISCT